VGFRKLIEDVPRSKGEEIRAGRGGLAYMHRVGQKHKYMLYIR